jgi:Flp pilus assembly protein TadG
LCGVLVFLILLLFATQVLVGLYARSVMTSAAFDAARTVAGGQSAGQPDAVAGAEATARARMGSFGTHVVFDWREVSVDRVVLEVHANPPVFLPLHLSPLGPIDRTVIVRTERFR